MCGENLNLSGTYLLTAGSPPHVRGKPATTAMKRLRVGITPACAGKTRLFDNERFIPKDHPRMCGENQITFHGLRHSHGITPACAGKTDGSSISLKSLEDHPRMCGENQNLTLNTRTFQGSPPHVRGKRLQFHDFSMFHGSPPHVRGKLFVSCPVGNFFKDHPRMCGENPIIYMLFLGDLGSPPHVRGKHLSNPVDYPDFRITPACAGKTCSANNCSIFSTDHPRMCGENIINLRQTRQELGSPPHVRGKLCSPGFLFQFFGDHPRMCGENSVFVAWCLSM